MKGNINQLKQPKTVQNTIYPNKKRNDDELPIKVVSCYQTQKPLKINALRKR